VVEALFQLGSIRVAHSRGCDLLVIGATRAPVLLDGILAVEKHGQITG
jgi:hypothetical protein